MKALIHQITLWDVALLGRVFGIGSHAGFVNTIRAVTRSADGYLYPLLPALFFILELPWASDFLIAAFVAFAIELPAYRILKNGIRRPRPFEAIAHLEYRIAPPDQFSFPSGHTAAAFVLATLLSNFIPVLMPLLVLWAIGVAFSRVFLGVHYPTDTLAGATLGIGCAAIGLSLTSWLP